MEELQPIIDAYEGRLYYTEFPVFPGGSMDIVEVIIPGPSTDKSWAFVSACFGLGWKHNKVMPHGEAGFMVRLLRRSKGSG